MNRFITRTTLCAVLSLMAVGSVVADDGHGHDAPVAAAGAALPRFAAVSKTFELVGVLSGKQLTLYLDHFANNAPVKEAQLALEVGGVQIPVDRHAEGEFEAELAQVPASGELAIVAMVTADTASERLTGHLDIQEAAVIETAVSRPRWQTMGLWVLGGLFAIGVVTWIARRTRSASTRRVGGAA